MTTVPPKITVCQGGLRRFLGEIDHFALEIRNFLACCARRCLSDDLRRPDNRWGEITLGIKRFATAYVAPLQSRSKRKLPDCSAML